MGIVAVIGGSGNRTSLRLVSEWRTLGLEATLLSGAEARRVLGSGDVALGRIDVLETVDGVEPGLLDLLLVERAGVPVLNGSLSLVLTHDKLRTSKLMLAAGLPHPQTGIVLHPDAPLPVRPPLVVKPRFGSWGVAVHRCETEGEARRCLHAVAGTPWFARHGAIMQELVPTATHDLRILVAGGRAVGAVHRTPAPGEWRSNVTLGGTAEHAAPGGATEALAVAAAAATGCDLVAVDLLPLDDGGHVVLELNGAADFDERYAAPGHDVFADVANALRLDRNHPRRPGPPSALQSR